MQEYLSKSKEQTQKIASNIAKRLKGGEILCFYGNLGSGKTTFIQALAKTLGIKENVTSPTFVLMKRYEIKKLKKSKRFLYHIDTYRMNSSEEVINLGIEEIWNDKNNITAIEWADKINDILPWKRIDICFENKGENERKITIFEN